MKRDTDKPEGHMRPAIPECGRDHTIQQIKEIGLQKDIAVVEQKLQECLTMHQNVSGLPEEGRDIIEAGFTRSQKHEEHQKWQDQDEKKSG